MSEEPTNDQPDQSDPTPFTFNWHDLREFDDWERFLTWFTVHVVVPQDGNHDQERYDELVRATDGFTNVELKILVNGIEGNTQHTLESIHRNMVVIAQRAAVEELRNSAEFRNMKRTLRALEGAVIDRAEQVARGFGLTLSKDDND